MAAVTGLNKKKTGPSKNKKTSIGHSKNTKIKNRQTKRLIGKKLYRGQGR